MKEPKFKKGDQVVMHSCREADMPENKGVIFTCKNNDTGTVVLLEGFGVIEVKFLAIVFPEKIRETTTFEMQNLEVKDYKVPKVIAELGRRGIMFIQTKSKDEGYQMIYFKAASEVMSYIIHEIL